MSLRSHYKLRIPLGIVWTLVNSLCIVGWYLMFKKSFYISPKNFFALLGVVWYVLDRSLSRAQPVFLTLFSLSQAQQLHHVPLLRLSRNVRAPGILLLPDGALDRHFWYVSSPIHRCRMPHLTQDVLRVVVASVIYPLELANAFFGVGRRQRGAGTSPRPTRNRSSSRAARAWASRFQC